MLDVRFFRVTRPFLIPPDTSIFCFHGFHDCNSVHYQCGLTSIVLKFCLHYSQLIMISYADATLVGELLSISVYTVHLIAYDGSCLTHYMTAATLMMYKELTYVDAVDLSLYLCTATG